MSWFIIHDILTAKKPKATVFSTNSMSSKHPQNHIVPQVQGGFLSGHNFQDFDFWGAQILWEFFSPSFGWVLPVAWPRAAAPEAEHRCTAQPAKATIPWSSGSSRRRRPWMLRTKRAVASEEDLGEETSWGLGIPLWGSVWRCWWFTNGSTFWWILFYLFGKRVQTFAPMFGVVVCEHNYTCDLQLPQNYRSFIFFCFFTLPPFFLVFERFLLFG